MDDPPRITLPLFLYGNQPLQRNVAHNTPHVELLKTSPYSEFTLFPSVATSTPINKYFLSDIYLQTIASSSDYRTIYKIVYHRQNILLQYI